MSTIPKNIIGNTEGDALKILEQEGFHVVIIDPETNRNMPTTIEHIEPGKRADLYVHRHIVKSAKII